MTKNSSNIIVRYIAALAAVSVITFFYLQTRRFNPTTIAFTYLLAILGVSTIWGLAVSVFMSLIATLAYNYFFLPPTGTFAISDPQNWLALVTFLVTSVLASDLATRARNQAAEANRRRREVERLYRFSQRLLSAGNPIELLNAIVAPTPAGASGDEAGSVDDDPTCMHTVVPVSAATANIGSQ